MQGLKLSSGLHLVDLELARDVWQFAQVARRWTHNYATNHLRNNGAVAVGTAYGSANTDSSCV